MKRRTFNTLMATGLAAAPLSRIQSQKNLSKSVYLKKGDTIGLITPSGPIKAERLERTKTYMNQLGFKVFHTDNVLLQDGYLAGSDSARIADLHQMFLNEKVQGIWCIRGGYGATRYLDYLDFDLIRQNQKPLIGYSDVTALLNTIQQKTNNPCFHGPIAGSKFTAYSTKHLRPIYGIQKDHTIQLAEENILRGKEDEDFQFYVIHPGVAKGKLAGGNLSLLVSLVGTSHAVETDGRLVFIEDVGEEPYRIDRMLTHLISSGFFNKVNGVVFGIFNDCKRKDENSWTLQEVIRDRMKNIMVPSVYGFPIGHIPNQCTLPIGVQAMLDTKNQTLRLLK